ncbi:MAG: hypothetical protein L6R39_007243 [Caloplaca ligustica]|nr:MAG: hypothetical protein L6R39_007243 [Caloplaca ligustica]
MDTDSARIETIRQLIEANPYKHASLEHLCYAHLKAIGGHCGLQSKTLKRVDLQYRIEKFYEYRSDLNALRANLDSAVWFRLADRPAIPDDSLSIYSTMARKPLQLVAITDAFASQLVDEVCGHEGAWSEWQDVGNLVVDGLFRWVFDGITADEEYEGGIGPLVEEEYLMYEHHQREINGRSNKGWLRTMMYSLIQQLVRQDLQYYILYVAARPDHNQRLISYPYYTKFARPGDSTIFRHVDMNIPEFLATGRGGNVIQGSVSLDDETAVTGCTEIVPGMHRRLRDWWADVEARSAQGQKVRDSGRVHNVTSLWHPSDVAKYGKWTSVPCRRGDVRVTRPELIHGSTATSAIRRTILPWFVGLQRDGKSLDNPESGNWNDLCVAHMRQERPPNTPSGHPNMYGAIPHRFPPATRLNLESPVSQALVCARAWDDPAVVQEANFLLGSDRVSARQHINQARLRALRAYKVAFKKQVEAERQCFGSDSFYERRDKVVLEARAGGVGEEGGNLQRQC